MMSYKLKDAITKARLERRDRELVFLLAETQKEFFLGQFDAFEKEFRRELKYLKELKATHENTI